MHSGEARTLTMYCIALRKDCALLDLRQWHSRKPTLQHKSNRFSPHISGAWGFSWERRIFCWLDGWASLIEEERKTSPPYLTTTTTRRVFFYFEAHIILAIGIDLMNASERNKDWTRFAKTSFHHPLPFEHLGLGPAIVG